MDKNVLLSAVRSYNDEEKGMWRGLLIKQNESSAHGLIRHGTELNTHEGEIYSPDGKVLHLNSWLAGK